jgi:lipid-A-disaccharide synthase
MLNIGIVANEPSGDQLGAAVVRALRERLPDARFIGVAGPRMLEEGCETLLPMESLSVMGLVEVLKVLPRLLAARRRLVEQLRALRPSVVIGVDAPDFNLGLERRLRDRGIKTVHLVSPTVWAWRPKRVKTIRKAVDLLLSIFPFEEPFLREHGVPVCYIGHPLADAFPLTVDQERARLALGLPANRPIVAVLPGSREGEMARNAESFIKTASWCHDRRPELLFVAPMTSQNLQLRFRALLAEHAPSLPITIVDGNSHQVLASADCVLTASGTATLEGLLTKRPMVVGYRISPLTYQLVKRLKLIKVPYAAMANLLVGRELAPEFLQHRCRPSLMGPALLELLDDSERREHIAAEYRRIHIELRRNAARSAAQAIVGLIVKASS